MVFGAEWDEPLTPEQMQGHAFTVEELKAQTPVDGRVAHGQRPYDPSTVDVSALPICPRPHCKAATGEHCKTWNGALCWPHKPRLVAAGKVRPRRRRRRRGMLQ